MDLTVVVRSANDLYKSIRSYSPEVNEKLVSKRPDKKAVDMFGCGLEETLIDGDNLFKRRNSKVKVGEHSVCKAWNSNEAKNLMLDNLRASNNFDPANVVTPQQIDSNCWFNVFFVTFFISDKGRKFFRFFRELMIRGEDVNGRKIPDEMAHAFFFLNACIEAAYNNKNVALAMNTNHVVLKIYDSIRTKDIARMSRQGLTDVDEAGNPLEYYAAIMDYIGAADNIRYKRVYQRSHIEALFQSKVKEPTPLHLYIVQLVSGFGLEIPLKFKVGKHTYALDASTVIDTNGEHFCSTLMCGGKEMGFDGGSFSRLEPFKWKALLNKNKNWTFEGSIFDHDKKDKVWWNYQKSYTMLFYYRV